MSSQIRRRPRRNAVAAVFGLSAPQIAVLTAIADGKPYTATQIAVLTGKGRGPVQRIVRWLCDNGYVEPSAPSAISRDQLAISRDGARAVQILRTGRT